MATEQSREYQRRWRAKQLALDPVAFRAKESARSKRYQAKHRDFEILRSAVGLAKKRAERQGVPFLLDPRLLTVPERCPVLGVPLLRGKGVSTDNSPTLDRKDPAKGYTHDNVEIISMKANRIKSNATAEDLRAVLSYVSKIEYMSTLP